MDSYLPIKRAFLHGKCGNAVCSFFLAPHSDSQLKNMEEVLVPDFYGDWLQNSSFKADLLKPCAGSQDAEEEDAVSVQIQAGIQLQRNEEVNVVNTHVDALLEKGEEANEIQQERNRQSPRSADKYESEDIKQKKEKKNKSDRTKKSKKHKRSRSKSPIRKSHKELQQGNKKVITVPPPNKVFLEDMRGLGYADGYRLDRKRDRDNYSFGSMNRQHLSKYKAFSKVPWGLKRDQYHLWIQKQGKSRQIERYYKRASRQASYRPGEKLNPHANIDFSESPFIPCPHSTPPGARNKENPLGILDESTLLWTQGKAPTDGSSPPPVSSYLDSSVSQSIAFYNRSLRETPDNIALWIKLIEVQDGLLEQRTDDESSKLFTDKLIQDKKLAILAQALKHNPSSLQLMLKRLELQSKSLDSADLNEEWRKLTFAHVNNVQVWKGYLHHVKTCFSKFTMSVLVKAYAKCLNSLRRVSQGLLKSHRCLPNTVEHMIEILLELCDLLHLANCTEKAVAIARAMIEFNLHRPSSCETHEQAVQSFQDFYDSGVPRFGEPGAKGWCNATQYKVIPAPLKSTAAQDEEAEEKLLESCESSSRAETWLRLERSRQLSHWLPWRPAANETDEDCEDPHRLVLSDDFVDLLFYVEDEQLRIAAHLRLLDWLGLGSNHCPNSYSHVLSGVNQLPRVTSPEGCQMLVWSDHLLNDLFISHCTEQMMSQLTVENKSRLIIQRLYHQLDHVLAVTDKKESKKKGKEFKNYAKSILSLPENRANRELWLTFAHCNRELGLYSEMDQVYDALAVPTSCSGKEPVTSSRCELWWQVVSGAVAQKKPCVDKLLAISSWLVCGAFPSTTPTASHKLMLVRELESSLNSLSEGLKGPKIQHVTSLLTYLLPCYYLVLTLTKGLSRLDALLGHWSTKLARQFNKCHLKAYYIRVAAVLKYIHRDLYKSVTPIFRSMLQTALNDLPYSSELLLEYLAMERSSHTMTRVRQFFTSHLAVDQESATVAEIDSVERVRPTDAEELGTAGQHDATEASNVTEHCDVAEQLDSRLELGAPGEFGTKELLAVFAVLFELEQLERIEGADMANRGINNRIRSLCARCLARVSPNSVLLWRLYLYHEVKYGSRAKVESIFYAAVQACPYAKCIYVDAITYMPDLLTKVVGIAEEKEVRIHTPLDELDILLHKE
ncbi:nuclear exosome regulator NRDE2-like [Watersipora subatra]|uniref:nuclear exosome regulator NRDE2-like n=1 Tax=Watersipora subatra TaxID=2589382 RepID=UPI00355BB1E6